MKSILDNLPVEIKYDFFPEETGGSHPHGDSEKIPAHVSITSVKIQLMTGHGLKEVDIVEVLDADTISSLELEILEQHED